MRFLSMIRIDENTGQAPSEQLMNDMGKLIEHPHHNRVMETFFPPTKTCDQGRCQ